MKYPRRSGSHRDADKTVSELGSNGVAMEVTQPECPSKVPLNDKLSAMLAGSPPNKWYFDPRSPLSTEKGRRLACNCTDRKAQFSETFNPWDQFRLLCMRHTNHSCSADSYLQCSDELSQSDTRARNICFGVLVPAACFLDLHRELVCDR